MSENQRQKKKIVRRSNKEIEASDELFVKMVQLHKDLLFGAFSPTVTAAAKIEKWEEIRQEMVKKGDKLVAAKDAKYLQSTLWKNIATKTKEKRDCIKATTGAEPKAEDLSAVTV
jgi:hypothetical protein